MLKRTCLPFPTKPHMRQVVMQLKRICYGIATWWAFGSSRIHANAKFQDSCNMRRMAGFLEETALMVSATGCTDFHLNTDTFHA